MALFYIIAVLMIARGVMPTCNVCSTSNIICIASNQYQYCSYPTGTLISSTIYTCATGTLCSASAVGNPCSAAVVTPDCPVSTCGQCTGIKACISDTQFYVCQNGVSTNTSISCASGLICDPTNTAVFCTAGAVSTCSTSTTTNTTCTTTGRFPTPNTSCKSYYLCSLVNSVLYRYEYNCTGTYNFNPTTKQCTTYTCTTT